MGDGLRSWRLIQLFPNPTVAHDNVCVITLFLVFLVKLACSASDRGLCDNKVSSQYK